MPVISGGQVQTGNDREDLRYMFKAYYTFAAVGSQPAQGGAIGTVDLVDEGGHVVVVPDNFIVTRATIQNLVIAASGGAATIALGTSEAGKSAVILAATAYNAAPFTAVDALLAGAAALPALTTAPGSSASLRATIAGAALTAGRFVVTIDGYIGD